jgi:hypothetical protein
MEIRKPPLLIVYCPPVQLALDPEYPLLSHLGPGHGAALFNADLLAFQTNAANPLPSFAM